MGKIFWNVKNKDTVDKKTFIEHTLKYGDFDDITKLFKKYNSEFIKDVWLKTMANDKRFLKVNLMIARVFLDMDVESDYFKRLDNGRFKVSVSVKKIRNYFENELKRLKIKE